MKPSLQREQKLFDALKRIASYEPPERLRKTAEGSYGLEPDEVIEMAYENVLAEAKSALRGMQRPSIPTPQGDSESKREHSTSLEP